MEPIASGAVPEDAAIAQVVPDTLVVIGQHTTPEGATLPVAAADALPAGAIDSWPEARMDILDDRRWVEMVRLVVPGEKELGSAGTPPYRVTDRQTPCAGKLTSRSMR
jgi:hypothetical protein